MAAHCPLYVSNLYLDMLLFDLTFELFSISRSHVRMYIAPGSYCCMYLTLDILQDLATEDVVLTDVLSLALGTGVSVRFPVDYHSW
jgi:hypothetical protein